MKLQVHVHVFIKDDYSNQFLLNCRILIFEKYFNLYFLTKLDLLNCINYLFYTKEPILEHYMFQNSECMICLNFFLVLPETAFPQLKSNYFYTVVLLLHNHTNFTYNYLFSYHLSSFRQNQTKNIQEYILHYDVIITQKI